MAAWWQASATDAARQIQCQRWSNKRSYCNIDVLQKQQKKHLWNYHDFPEKEFFSRLSQRLGDKKFLT
jgi:hypothetical protein